MTTNGEQPRASTEGVGRRSLLTGSALVSAALGGAAIGTSALAFNAMPEENAPRYKLSEHVKTFYRVAGR